MNAVGHELQWSFHLCESTQTDRSFLRPPLPKWSILLFHPGSPGAFPSPSFIYVALYYKDPQCKSYFPTMAFEWKVSPWVWLGEQAFYSSADVPFLSLLAPITAFVFVFFFFFCGRTCVWQSRYVSILVNYNFSSWKALHGSFLSLATRILLLGRSTVSCLPFCLEGQVL